MKPLPIMVYAGAIAIAGMVLAADPGFTAADQNGDGLLSADEVATAMPDATPEAFSAADTDQSGTLTEAEFLAAIESGLLPSG